MNPTLLLSRSEVARLLTMPECIDAIEKMFRLLGEGKLPPPGILGIKSKQGGLHIKAGLFVAAVGADDSHKQEIDPALRASAKVVAEPGSVLHHRRPPPRHRGRTAAEGGRLCGVV